MGSDLSSAQSKLFEPLAIVYGKSSYPNYTTHRYSTLVKGPQNLPTGITNMYKDVDIGDKDFLKKFKAFKEKMEQASLSHNQKAYNLQTRGNELLEALKQEYLAFQQIKEFANSNPGRFRDDPESQFRLCQEIDQILYCNPDVLQQYEDRLVSPRIKSLYLQTKSED